MAAVNITFLFLLFSLIVFVYLIQNLLNISNRGSSRLIWMLVVVNLFVMTEAVLRISGVIEAVPHFFMLPFPLKFLIGPLVLGTASLQFNQRSFRPGRKELWIPVVAGYAIFLPIYILGGVEKISLIDEFPPIVLFMDLALVIHLGFYLKKLIVFTNRLSDKRLIGSKHLKYLNIGLGVYLVIQILVSIDDNYRSSLEMIAAATLIASVLVFRNGVSKSHVLSNNKLAEKIEKTVQSEKLFLDPVLNLGALAEHLNVSAHSVSEAINSSFSVNFNDYINQKRVSEVIELLKDEENAKYTLQAISEMAGFRSMTTFNTAFKKKTGKTPKEYKF